MELRDALGQRRMTRSFTGEPVDLDLLDGLCAEALRAPTAGNAAGVSMITVERQYVSSYLAVATDAAWRGRAVRAPALARAGAVVVVTSNPVLYTKRYEEADKMATELSDEQSWPVPYWHTDAAMATMALLLLLEEAALGATLWGNFRNEGAVLEWAGASEHARLFGTVLVGHRDGHDHRSRSLDRVGPSRRDRVRRFVGQ